jgi:CRP/FNR family transcriptional regulator, polysaccharide utilization system transcription regulator
MISPSVKNKPKGEIPYSDYLTTEQVVLINNNSNTVKFSSKDIIFKQNTRTSHVMFVKSGLIKIFKEGRNKKVIIFKIVTPNHFLANISVFGEETFRYSASAITDAEILFIDIATFKSIIEQNGKYASLLLQLVSTDNLYFFDKLMTQNQKQLPGRVAELLLYFSKQIYNSDTFEFPLSRTEIAELAGTTKESIIRTLTEFKNDKIIDINGKHIKINSFDIINRLSKLG